MSVTGLLYIPKLNPLMFHQVNLGDFWQNEIPSPDYQDVTYCQLVNGGDIFYLQFLAAFDMTTAATVITLIDNDETVVDTYTVVANGTYGDLSSFYVKDYFAVTTGVHYIRIVINYADASATFLSEPINIGTHTDTVFLMYRHSYNIMDCKFGGVDTPMFYLRVKGGLKSDGFAPGGKFTMYTDLDFRPVMLQTQPYSLYKWTFGDGRGIPNWVAERINLAFSLDYTFIDNIQYMRNEGAKLEPNRDGIFPMAGWTLETLQVANEYSSVFSGGGATIHDGTWDDTRIVDDTKIFSEDETP